MEQIAGEKAIQLTGCTDVSCAVQLGNALNVKKMVFGSVGKLGSKYIVFLKVVDVERENVECSDREEGLVPVEQIPGLVPPVVRRVSGCLSGKPVPGTPQPAAQQQQGGVVELGAGVIRVPTGTEVPVEITEKLSSATHSSGQEFGARVAVDVTVAGKTVIRAGTLVVAVVESARKAGAVGSEGMLAISLQSTNAVDGTKVALSGGKEVVGKGKMGSSVAVTVLCCILGLLMKGDNAVIPSGTQLIARTVTEAVINVGG